MKKIAVILSTFIFVFASSITLPNGKIENIKEKQETITNSKPTSCSTQIKTSTKTNSNGTKTQTTTTTVTCDTPEELAQFHKLMTKIGMGV